MAYYTLSEIEEMNKGRKKAKKLKPPKKKYRHSGDDIYNEFNIILVETNLKRDKWKSEMRRRKAEEMRKLRCMPGKKNKNNDSN